MEKNINSIYLLLNLMDVKDESVNFDDFNKKYPWVPSEELKKLAKKNI
jgi:hypothetical protein